MKKANLVYGLSAIGVITAGVFLFFDRTSKSPIAKNVCGEYSLGVKIPDVEKEAERLKSLGVLLYYALGSSAEYDSRYIAISGTPKQEKPTCTIEFKNGIIQAIK